MPSACAAVLSSLANVNRLKIQFTLNQDSLAILRHELEDVQPAGAVYRIEKGQLAHRTKDGWSSSGIPDWLADSAVRRDQAPARNCDIAAEKLNQLVVGIPLYHVLRKDSQQRLAAIKEFLDRFRKKLRFPSRLLCQGQPASANALGGA